MQNTATVQSQIAARKMAHAASAAIHVAAAAVVASNLDDNTRVASGAGAAAAALKLHHGRCGCARSSKGFNSDPCCATRCGGRGVAKSAK
jgi:hypothetical protein